MSESGKDRATLAGLLLAPASATAVAFLLRLVGLWWGLPREVGWARHFFSYHPDEIFVLLPSFGFAHGDLNPHFFNYGTLYIYLVGLPAAAFGLVPETPFPEGLAPLYLMGRLITALLGTATVLLLYLVLRREDRPLALTSAFLLAICPLHVVNSHYATVDVPATFFVTLAFLLALRGAANPDWRAAALTGLAVGLAAATKYNTGLFLVPALFAPLLARQAKVGAPWWLGVPLGAMVGFAVATPYLGSPEFLRGFLLEWRHAQAGGTLAFVGAGSGWAYHLRRGLPFGLGYPMLAAVLVGLAASLRSRSLAVRLSLLWILLYLFVIGFGRERFIRYLLPIMPFVSVLAAVGLVWLGRRGQKWRLARKSVIAAIVALTALYSLGQLLPLAISKHDMAWLQIESDLLHAHPEFRIGLVNTPWYYHPPVSPYNAGAFSRPMFEAWNAAQGNRVIVTGWDREVLARSRPEAFIISDLESSDPLRLRKDGSVEFVAEINRLYAERHTFAPLTPFSWLAPRRALAPPDWLYPEPTITVYHSPHGTS